MIYPTNLGAFFGFIRDIILECPLYDLLYLNFAVMLVFAILKRTSTKGA